MTTFRKEFIRNPDKAVRDINCRGLVKVLLYTSHGGQPINTPSSVEQRIGMVADPNYEHRYQEVNPWLVPYCLISEYDGRESIDGKAALDRLKLDVLFAQNEISDLATMLSSHTTIKTLCDLYVGQPSTMQDTLRAYDASRPCYDPIRICRNFTWNYTDISYQQYQDRVSARDFEMWEEGEY